MLSKRLPALLARAYRTATCATATGSLRFVDHQLEARRHPMAAAMRPELTAACFASHPQAEEDNLPDIDAADKENPLAATEVPPSTPPPLPAMTLSLAHYCSVPPRATQRNQVDRSPAPPLMAAGLPEP